MEIVTVSPKYQVVIPLSIRKALGLKPGQKVELREKDGRVELIPQKPITAYRGMLRASPPTSRTMTSECHRLVRMVGVPR